MPDSKNSYDKHNGPSAHRNGGPNADPLGVDDGELAHSQEARAWNAVQSRDPLAADQFVYAVVTTGIYCRPTCSSRRPLRRNVRFFTNCDHAAAAGFRACKRCLPAPMTETSRQSRAVLKACRLLERSEESISLAQLAEAVHLSPWHFQRSFKSHLGVTPHQYALALKRRRLDESLRSSNSVLDAATEAGFESISGFYARAQQLLGMPPSVVRAGAAGVVMDCAVVAAGSFGFVVVAATEQGVCCVEFGDSEAGLLQRLRERYPLAEVHTGGPEFRETVQVITDLLRTTRFESTPGADGVNRAHQTLPLDIQGTAFQEQVWQVLQGIPTGKTMSYQDVAVAIGKPGSHRAVANACGANPVALLIPCHRVVGSDGTLGGYRWGAGRKARLLDVERPGG